MSSSFFFLASACTKPSSTAWSQWSTLSSPQGSRGKKNHFREYPAPNIAFCKRFPLLRYNKYFLNILNKICQFMNKFSTRLDMPAIPKILRTHVTARLHVSLFILFLQRKWKISKWSATLVNSNWLVWPTLTCCFLDMGPIQGF